MAQACNNLRIRRHLALPISAAWKHLCTRLTIMSDSSDGSGDPEPNSPPSLALSEEPELLSATDEDAELSDQESDWGSDSESPVLVSDDDSSLGVLSLSSTSGTDPGDAPLQEISDVATSSPGPDRIPSNEEADLSAEWDLDAEWSDDEDSSSSSGSETTASPNRPVQYSVPDTLHTPTGDDATRQQDKGEAREPEKTYEQKKTQEHDQDDEQELEGASDHHSTRQWPGQDDGQELEGSSSDQSTRSGSFSGPASVASSVPSELYTLVLERLEHIEQRIEAVEAQAELGLYLAETELPAAVEVLRDTLADVQAQLKVALEGRACDAADVHNPHQRLLPNSVSSSSTPSGGPEVNVLHGSDAVCFVVTLSFVLAVMLMWLLYPLL